MPCGFDSLSLRDASATHPRRQVRSATHPRRQPLEELPIGEGNGPENRDQPWSGGSTPPSSAACVSGRSPAGRGAQVLTACAVEPALGVRVPLLPRRGRSSGAECRSDMPATKVRFLPTSPNPSRVLGGGSAGTWPRRGGLGDEPPATRGRSSTGEPWSCKPVMRVRLPSVSTIGAPGVSRPGGRLGGDLAPPRGARRRAPCNTGCSSTAECWSHIPAAGVRLPPARRLKTRGRSSTGECWLGRPATRVRLPPVPRSSRSVVRLPARRCARLRRRWRLVTPARCLRAEAGSIPVDGATWPWVRLATLAHCL